MLHHPLAPHVAKERKLGAQFNVKLLENLYAQYEACYRLFISDINSAITGSRKEMYAAAFDLDDVATVKMLNSSIVTNAIPSNPSMPFQDANALFMSHDFFQNASGALFNKYFQDRLRSEGLTWVRKGGLFIVAPKQLEVIKYGRNSNESADSLLTSESLLTPLLKKSTLR